MASPYVGEIRCFGFQFAPQGWAFCNGQLMAIADNTVLFSILGTTFGGDGETTFGLPNLQGRIPMHWGSGPGGFNTTLGENLGEPTVTLTATQIALHTHTITAANVPAGGVVGARRAGLCAAAGARSGSAVSSPPLCFGSVGRAGDRHPMERRRKTGLS